jgi:outer membrane lipoprotein-sorting protein
MHMLTRRLASPLVLVAALAALGTLGAGCSREKTAEGDKLALSDAVTAIAERTKKVRDYRYRGVATNLAGPGGAMKFTYQLKQPQMLRADLEDINTTFLFDGKQLAVIDGGQKKVLKQDLSKKDEVTIVTTLHQMFGDYVCEGWKPPLLRTKKGETAGKVEKREDGAFYWVLSTALDDADLKEVRYTLRAPHADFVKKEWVRKDGSIFAYTEVKEEHRDERTKLSFPLAWEHKDARRHYRVAVSDIELNKGLTPEPFEIKVPEGFSLQELGK